MYAKSLERLLSQYFSKAELGHETFDSFERRFKALRGCGLLPRGRENREQILSNEQIAVALLGATATQPDWAGFEAIGLSNLRPVGGIDASFHGTETLLKAVVILLQSAEARKCLINVTLSSAECGVNSHSYARIIFESDNGSIVQVSSVSPQAVSLLQSGAEQKINHFRRYAKASRETVLSPNFFESLAREIENSIRFQRPPPGDGSEYSAEEAEAIRRKRLGARAGSTYLNIGVDSHVAWPSVETLVKFDRYDLVLMPRTRDHSASIHIDLTHQRLSQRDANTVLNRFLSLMTWVDDHYAVAQDGWSGNPIPVAVPRRELAFVTAHDWFFERNIPVTEEARRALALYREARNAQENFLVSYAVLNFYKILEIRYPEGEKTRAWIAARLPEVEAAADHDDVKRFHEACAGQPAEKYIYDACRLAVAHASIKSPSDPDDTSEISRLHVAADMLRLLSRYFIINELKVSDGRTEVK